MGRCTTVSGAPRTTHHDTPAAASGRGRARAPCDVGSPFLGRRNRHREPRAPQTQSAPSRARVNIHLHRDSAHECNDTPTKSRTPRIASTSNAIGYERHMQNIPRARQAPSARRYSAENRRHRNSPEPMVPSPVGYWVYIFFFLFLSSAKCSDV